MSAAILEDLAAGFVTTVEVVPPAGPDPQPLLAKLAPLAELPIWGFSVASNPVAKPRMSALACCALVNQRTRKPAILHLTTRDHNRLALQGLVWGAKALGIRTVLAATGDFVALANRPTTSSVRDTDVLGLIGLAREAGLQVGVVLDPDPAKGGLSVAAGRLKAKVAAGAQFVVTQPVYAQAEADAMAKATAKLGVPVVLGILPLRSARHARFLHEKVAGIEVPAPLRARMEAAADPVTEGLANARELFSLARAGFAGACLMPPFDHFEGLGSVLGEEKP